MIPEMIKRGYPRVFATNITSAARCRRSCSRLAQLRHLLDRGGGTISIAHLFMPHLPGLLFGLCLVVLVLLIAKSATSPGDPISLRDSLKIALDSIWGLVTIVIILGASFPASSRPPSRAVAASTRSCDDVRLPRLQMEPASAPRPPDGQDGGDGDDADRFSVAFGYSWR